MSDTGLGGLEGIQWHTTAANSTTLPMARLVHCRPSTHPRTLALVTQNVLRLSQGPGPEERGGVPQRHRQGAHRGGLLRPVSRPMPCLMPHALRLRSIAHRIGSSPARRLSHRCSGMRCLTAVTEARTRNAPAGGAASASRLVPSSRSSWTSTASEGRCANSPVTVTSPHVECRRAPLPAPHRFPPLCIQRQSPQPVHT